MATQITTVNLQANDHFIMALKQLKLIEDPDSLNTPLEIPLIKK
jgi:hypothetical protein